MKKERVRFAPRRDGLSSLGTKLSLSLYDKFDEKCTREGRIKRITIVRLLKAHIEQKYSEVLEEEE